MDAMEEYLTGELVPKLVRGKVFGPGSRLCEVEVTPLSGYGEDYFASRIFKIKLHLKNRVVSLIAKFITEGFGIYADGDLCGQNEVEMYRSIIPFFDDFWNTNMEKTFKKPGIFINCYWAQLAPYKVVVMDDMSAAGFRLATSRHYLDLQHVLLALRRLGVMHALSYAAKVKVKSKFLEVARIIKESRFTEKTIGENVTLFRLTSLSRIERVLQSGELSLPTNTLQRLKEKLRDSSDIVRAALSPDEPWAVIVHGDFCRNNLLFKYDGVSGKPVDIRFFDFQTPRYCSPSVDLAFLIFLNTSSELRSNHWDDLFYAYYDELTKTFNRAFNAKFDSSGHLPTLEQVGADFRRHAAFSFLLCCYFLPMMVTPAEQQPSVRELAWDGRDGLSPQQVIADIGGRDSDLLVRDLVQEFVQRELI